MLSDPTLLPRSNLELTSAALLPPLHESPEKVYAAKITQTNLKKMDSNQKKPKSWL